MIENIFSTDSVMKTDTNSARNFPYNSLLYDFEKYLSSFSTFL